MIPITIALVVVQEMSSRMGAVTGKGLSDLIREEFGFRVTFLLMAALVVTNFGNVVAEFAGVASSLELFGISSTSSFLVAAIVWLLVVQGTYGSVEKIFLAASAFTSATSSPVCWPIPTGRPRRSLPSAARPAWGSEATAISSW